MSPPLPKLVVDFEGDKDVDLYGCFSPCALGFSPHVGSSSTPQVLSDFEGVAFVEVVSPVLQIMPELQMLCGEPVSPLSMEQLRLDSLQTLEVDLVSSPPHGALSGIKQPTSQHHGAQSFRCCRHSLVCDHRAGDACEWHDH